MTTAASGVASAGPGAARPGVLVTRPRPDAEATAARLVAMGYVPSLAPMLLIARRSRVTAADLAGIDALVLTSANAARAIAEDLSPTVAPPPAYCVGAKTAAAARAAGIADARSAEGDAAALSRLIQADAPPGARLLVLRGADVAHDLTEDLAAAGFAPVTRIVYAAEAVRRPPPEAMAALAEGRIQAALFYSARTAEVFVETATLSLAKTPIDLSQAIAVAISARAADPLSAAGFGAVLRAPTPTQEALLDALRAAVPPRPDAVNPTASAPVDGRRGPG